MVSFQDEFGGYSSRLRLNNGKRQKVCEFDSELEDKGQNMELNLCELLNIDVEAIALRIAMGLDEDEDADIRNQSDIQKKNTAASSHESVTNEESIINVD